LTPHIGIRALGGDNQCLPVFGTGKARAVTASLKLPIRFGEIFAVFRHRAEEWTAYPINQPGVIKAKKKAPEPSPFRKPL
jgi:hypothetical protein